MKLLHILLATILTSSFMASAETAAQAKDTTIKHLVGLNTRAFSVSNLILKKPDKETLTAWAKAFNDGVSFIKKYGTTKSGTPDLNLMLQLSIVETNHKRVLQTLNVIDAENKVAFDGYQKTLQSIENNMIRVQDAVKNMAFALNKDVMETARGVLQVMTIIVKGTAKKAYNDLEKIKK